MKLTFLGTGAADWSRESAHLGDEKGLERRNTSLLLNDDLLIDPNSDVPEALNTFGCDMKSIKTVLISHSHGDHYSPDTLLWLAEDHPITVMSNSGYPKTWLDNESITFIDIKLGEDYSMGSYTVRAMESTHPSEYETETTFHFTVSDGERKIFYGCDGAWMLPRSFGKIGSRVDCAVMDATFGDDAQLYRVAGSGIFLYHNNTTMLSMLRAAFMNSGKGDEKTVFVANHLAKTYFPTTEKARMAFLPLGYVPSYDGMVLEL